jgi:hypothetical protein
MMIVTCHITAVNNIIDDDNDDLLSCYITEVYNIIDGDNDDLLGRISRQYTIQ